MKKLGVMLVGILAVMVLVACSGGEEKEREKVFKVHEDFHELVDGVDTAFIDTEDAVSKYNSGEYTYEEYKEIKQEREKELEEFKKDLDGISKPKDGDALDYYDKSFNLITGVITLAETSLEVPNDLGDEVAVEGYNDSIRAERDHLDVSIEEYEELQEELKEKDEEYKKAFK